MTTVALTPAEFVNQFYPNFWWIPAGVLAAALAIKLPSIIRLWKDPMLRAVGGLLLLACAVFVFVAPSTIARVNRLTGVANFSGPWVYSLLTAFCAFCLLLIISWRNGLSDRSDRTRRAMRGVVAVYSSVIVAMWVLFALADVPVERLRDLDVATLRADWTSSDPAIASALAAFGRRGVPLYVLYAPRHSDPVILPTLLTPAMVLDALSELPAS